MSHYDLYVGNDSGMTHLAAAIRLPTVAIFGTTDPHMWRPLGDHVRIVSPAEPQGDMTCVTLRDVRLTALDCVTHLLPRRMGDGPPEWPAACSLTV